jgi:hypothetical protein
MFDRWRAKVSTPPRCARNASVHAPCELENVGRVSSSERQRPPRYGNRMWKTEPEFKRERVAHLASWGRRNKVKGTGRVPHVRAGVRGPKTMAKPTIAFAKSLVNAGYPTSREKQARCGAPGICCRDGVMERSAIELNNYQRNPNVTGNMLTVPVPIPLAELVGEFTQT